MTRDVQICEVLLVNIREAHETSTLPEHVAALPHVYPGGFSGLALPHRGPVLREELAQTQDSEGGGQEMKPSPIPYPCKTSHSAQTKGVLQLTAPSLAAALGNGRNRAVLSVQLITLAGVAKPSP